MLPKPGTSSRPRSKSTTSSWLSKPGPLYSLFTSIATAPISGIITSTASKVSGLDLVYELESPGALRTPLSVPEVLIRWPGMRTVLWANAVFWPGCSGQQVGTPGPVLSSHFFPSGQDSQANSPSVPAGRVQATSPANRTLGAKLDTSSQSGTAPHSFTSPRTQRGVTKTRLQSLSKMYSGNSIWSVLLEQEKKLGQAPRTQSHHMEVLRDSTGSTGLRLLPGPRGARHSTIDQVL